MPRSAFWKTATVFIIAVFGGASMAVQARINGELGIRLDNSVQAALISFLTGLIFLTVLVAFVPSMRAGLSRIPERLRDRSLLRWHLFGGIAGGLFVVAQTFSVPLLGVTLFTLIGVAAELLSALFVDRIGLGPGGVRRLSPHRIAGACLALIAVFVASLGRFDIVALSVFAMLAVALAKFGTTVQVAINARVAEAAESALSAALVSFLVGAVFLCLRVGGCLRMSAVNRVGGANRISHW